MGLLLGATRTIKGSLSVKITARTLRKLQACLAALAGSKTPGIGFNAQDQPRSSARLIRGSILRIRSAARRIVRLLRLYLCASMKSNENVWVRFRVSTD